MKQKVKLLAKEFGLTYNSGLYIELNCSREEILIRNFLGGCPDRVYETYRKSEGNMGENLIRFVKSDNFKVQCEKIQGGCVISKTSLLIETDFIKQISDAEIRKKVSRLYEKIKKKMGEFTQLIILDKEMNQTQSKDIILHEFIHILINSNYLRPNSWKWNEGLVTYMTYFGMGWLDRIEGEVEAKPQGMWKHYINYANKWSKILAEAKTSSERKKIIESKIMRLNKKC